MLLKVLRLLMKKIGKHKSLTDFPSRFDSIGRYFNVKMLKKIVAF